MTQCAELCRIALTKHATPVSRIISIAVRLLKREMPAIRLIVSYADMNQGHLGKIYQASNWLFVGQTGHEAGIMLNGKLTHRRTINSKYGTSDIDWLRKKIDLAPVVMKANRNSNICCHSTMKPLNALSSCPSHTQTRRKQRHRCARPPVWRGR